MLLQKLFSPFITATCEAPAPATTGAAATAAAATHYHDATAGHEATDGWTAPASDGPSHRAANPGPADYGPAEYQSAGYGPDTAGWTRLHWRLIVKRSRLQTIVHTQVCNHRAQCCSLFSAQHLAPYKLRIPPCSSTLIRNFPLTQVISVPL